mgnify:CR=1 FL=1
MTQEPFVVHCETCSHEWAATYLPLPICATLWNAPCPMCGTTQVLVGPCPKPTVEGDPLAWLANGDTGTSSTTIWRGLTGSSEPTTARWNHDVPHDPDAAPLPAPSVPPHHVARLASRLADHRLDPGLLTAAPMPGRWPR